MVVEFSLLSVGEFCIQAGSLGVRILVTPKALDSGAEEHNAEVSAQMAGWADVANGA
jgi:hypothetical protein